MWISFSFFFEFALTKTSVLGGYTQSQLDHLSEAMVTLLSGIQSEIRMKKDRPHPYRRGGSVAGTMPDIPHTYTPHQPHHIVPDPIIGNHVVPLKPQPPLNLICNDFTLPYEAYLSLQLPPGTLPLHPPYPSYAPPVPPPGYPFPGVGRLGPYLVTQRSISPVRLGEGLQADEETIANDVLACHSGSFCRENPDIVHDMIPGHYMSSHSNGTNTMPVSCHCNIFSFFSFSPTCLTANLKAGEAMPLGQLDLNDIVEDTESMAVLEKQMLLVERFILALSFFSNTPAGILEVQ